MQEGQGGVFTGDSGVALIALVSVVEEACHILGHQLIVVLDEAVPGATDTFAARQGASGEVANDLENDILCEAS